MASLVPGELPAQMPVTRSFDIFFDLPLNKRLSKQSWGWWFEKLSRTFDVTVMFPHRNLLYHLNILLWEGIKRRAQDMTSLKWKRFPICIGHRGFLAQRASDTEIYLPAFNPFCPVLFVHIRQKTTPYPITCWQWFGFVLAMYGSVLVSWCAKIGIS